MFVLQIDNNQMLSTDTAVVYNLILFHNWFFPEDKIEFSFKQYENSIVKNKDIIPVGSIEFVEKYLKKNISPIIIPKELRKPDFLRRKIFFNKNKKDLLMLMQENFFNKIFVKSNTRIKSDITGIYSEKDLKYLKDNDLYFVSEYKNILSEYRCFIFQKNIKSIKNYLGDQWLKPDIELIEQMIKEYKNAPPAYTLDVAVTDNGETFLIETHNFISCGLYGFEDACILNMLESAYIFEKEKIK